MTIPEPTPRPDPAPAPAPVVSVTRAQASAEAAAARQQATTRREKAQVLRGRARALLDESLRYEGAADLWDLIGAAFPPDPPAPVGPSEAL